MKIRHEVKRTVVILSAERTERTAEQNERCHVNLLGSLKAYVGMYKNTKTNCAIFGAHTQNNGIRFN